MTSLREEIEQLEADYGVTATKTGFKDAILSAFQKRIEGMKKEVPPKQDLDTMALTLTNLELAEKAIEFHAFNQALDQLLEEVEK